MSDLDDFLDIHAVGRRSAAAWQDWPPEAIADLYAMRVMHTDTASPRYRRINLTVVRRWLRERHGVSATDNMLMTWVRRHCESGRWDP